MEELRMSEPPLLTFLRFSFWGGLGSGIVMSLLGMGPMFRYMIGVERIGLLQAHALTVGIWIVGSMLTALLVSWLVPKE